MNTKTKKGFTLTELIIVVVIIGILAAVLIPTLTACVKKAKISNDKQLVRNLNLALSTDSLANRDGAKHENMTEALKAADDAGYNVTKINATKADNEILWDSKHDVFCYYNDGQIEYIPASIPTGEELNVRDHAHLLWQIIDVEDENLVVNASKYKFSVYASGKASGINSITTDKGFDAGEQSFTLINYVHEVANPDENYEYVVVIRTNSFETSLAINAPKDTVKHYGEVGSLNVIAVANASYHENGKVAFAEITTGRIVLEEKSEVEHIHLNTSVVNNETVFNNITVAKAESVEMPVFSRDPVEIPEEGKLVVALQDGTDKDDAKDYVWLTAVGIYEQVVVSDQKESLTAEGANNSYAAASNDQEKKDTAQQIANNITFMVGEEEYKVSAKTTDGGATWTYEVVDEEGNKSDDYEAEKLTDENTVEVKTTDATPVVVTTKQENGVTSEEKAALKEESINAVVVNITASVETLGDGESFQFVSTGSNLFWSSSDTDVATISQNGLLTANGIGQTTVTVTDGEQVKTCDVTVTYFHDGEGTESSPFIIQNYKQLTNVSKYRSTYTFFKVNDGITTIDCIQSREKGYVIQYLNGQLDANNCKFINVEGNLIYYARAYDSVEYKTLVVKNVEAYINVSSTTNTGLVYYIWDAGSVTFDNVKVHGYIEGYMAAPYIGFYQGLNTPSHADILTFNNCYSDATIVAKNERACGFVCNFYYGYGKIVINNSEFNGIQYTASGNFSYVHGFNNSNIKIVFDADAATLAANHTNMTIVANTEYTSNNGANPAYDKDSTRTITFISSTTAYELGDKVSIGAANNAYYATITLFIGGNTVNNGGNFVGPYMTETITSKTNGSFVSESIVYCHCVVNPNGCAETESHFDASTNEYHVHNSYYDANTCGSAFITIAQYDTEDKVVGITTIQLPKN